MLYDYIYTEALSDFIHLIKHIKTSDFIMKIASTTSTNLIKLYESFVLYTEQRNHNIRISYRF
jgi:hypothetical protein